MTSCSTRCWTGTVTQAAACPARDASCRAPRHRAYRASAPCALRVPVNHASLPLLLARRRSAYLEEYSLQRPLSAGMRPRTLLNKVAQAAGMAAEDSDAEADNDPWVLEGWGEEPSVVSSLPPFGPHSRGEKALVLDVWQGRPDAAAAVSPRHAAAGGGGAVEADAEHQVCAASQHDPTSPTRTAVAEGTALQHARTAPARSSLSPTLHGLMRACCPRPRACCRAAGKGLPGQHQAAGALGAQPALRAAHGPGPRAAPHAVGGAAPQQRAAAKGRRQGRGGAAAAAATAAAGRPGRRRHGRRRRGRLGGVCGSGRHQGATAAAENVSPLPCTLVFEERRPARLRVRQLDAARRNARACAPQGAPEGRHLTGGRGGGGAPGAAAAQAAVRRCARPQHADLELGDESDVEPSEGFTHYRPPQPTHPAAPSPASAAVGPSPSPSPTPGPRPPPAAPPSSSSGAAAPRPLGQQTQQLVQLLNSSSPSPAASSAAPSAQPPPSARAAAGDDAQGGSPLLGRVSDPPGGAAARRGAAAAAAAAASGYGDALGVGVRKSPPPGALSHMAAPASGNVAAALASQVRGSACVWGAQGAIARLCGEGGWGCASERWRRRCAAAPECSAVGVAVAAGV